MDIKVFYGFVSAGIILLITHSYFKRGLPLTLNFFLFAFMLTFTKGGTHIFKFVDLIEEKPGPAVIFHAAVSSLIWMLAFYLSWCIAEKIVERSERLRARVFPTLLFSGLVIACLAYAIEATAINVGWWGRAVEGEGIFLLPLDIIFQWLCFSIYFMAAYFLIACSEYKNKEWKTIFFLLPFIHSWIPRFFGQGFPELIERIAVLSIILILAFTSPLRFDYSANPGPITSRRFASSELLNYLPLTVTLILLAILAFVDITIIHNGRLLVSLLPLSFLLFIRIIFAIQKQISLSPICLFGLFS